MRVKKKSSARRSAGILLAGALVGGLSLAGAGAASAHDVVVGGDPADGETLAEFPDAVTLEFSAIPREGFNTFAISDAATEEVLYSGEPEIDGRFLTVDIPDEAEGGAGDYRIGFQITSSDGHATRGMTTFTVEGGEAATPIAAAESEEAAAATPAAADTEQAQDTEQSEEAEQTGISGPWAWVIAGVAILVVLAVVVMVIQRQRVSRALDDHPENNPQNHPENN